MDEANSSITNPHERGRINFSQSAPGYPTTKGNYSRDNRLQNLR